ncbi:porin [Algivirga pacifica]|uniref:Porin n=1 Tax=Algivirga pacifica TaxID=1162670 RepID=A0ABP9D2E4_9BACT
MTLKQLLSSLSFILLPCVSIAQGQEGKFTVNGYLETYYIYDFEKPDNHIRSPLFYAYNRHNEVTLNLGYLRGAYESSKVRGELALMTGTYANANLAAEEGVLKNLYLANAGVRLSQKYDFWIDAGVFNSHIGFESAEGGDCLTMTRSLMAENSPYYESGVKLSYTSPNEKWFLSALVLNGWQRIGRVDGNNTPAGGHQITFSPSKNISINSSSFVGSDTPDEDRRMRYFHDLYGIFQFSEKMTLIVGFDVGAQQEQKGSSKYDLWYAPIIVGSYQMNKQFRLTGRVEYYDDQDLVIIPQSIGAAEVQTLGYSLNLDYSPYPNVLWRLEGRGLYDHNDPFIKNGTASSYNFFVGTSLGVSFGKVL